MDLPAFPLESIYPLVTARAIFNSGVNVFRRTWNAAPAGADVVNDAISTFESGTEIVTMAIPGAVGLIASRSQPPHSPPLLPTPSPVINDVRCWQDDFVNPADAFWGTVSDLQQSNRSIAVSCTVLATIIFWLLWSCSSVRRRRAAEADAKDAWQYHLGINMPFPQRLVPRAPV